MFDIGWAEMLVIGVVALIVVGPKDLPKMFHTVGQLMGKARGMAREFQRAMDAAARETGVSDIAKDIRKTASGQALKEAAGLDEIEKQFRDIGHDRPPVRNATTPARPAPRVEPDADETDADEADAREHDAAVAARNAEFSATEALRLKRADEAAAARVRAAEARARREADEGPTPPEPQAWRPATPPPASPPATPES